MMCIVNYVGKGVSFSQRLYPKLLTSVEGLHTQIKGTFIAPSMPGSVEKEANDKTTTIILLPPFLTIYIATHCFK